MKAGSKQSLPVFFIGLFFNPEVGGDKFLRISVNVERTTWRHIPEARALQSPTFSCIYSFDT
jgi:hypothetical protein